MGKGGRIALDVVLGVVGVMLVILGGIWVYFAVRGGAGKVQ